MSSPNSVSILASCPLGEVLTPRQTGVLCERFYESWTWDGLEQIWQSCSVDKLRSGCDTIDAAHIFAEVTMSIYITSQIYVQHCPCTWLFTSTAYPQTADHTHFWLCDPLACHIWGI